MITRREIIRIIDTDKEKRADVRDIIAVVCAPRDTAFRVPKMTIFML